MAALSTDDHGPHWERLRTRLANIILEASEGEAGGPAAMRPFASRYRAILLEAEEFCYDTDDLEKWALATALWWGRKRRE